MTEPAVPGVEEIARALCVSEGKDPDFDYDPLGLGRAAGTDLRWRCYEKQAQRILDLFAPILAEKERLAGIADAYAACESVARKRVNNIDPAFEQRLPDLCEIDRETWLAHKQRAPIMAVDMLQHAQLKAAEAALAGERERAVRETLLHVRHLLDVNGVPLGRDFEEVWSANARELYQA